jgi:hypothetical protein
VDDRTRKGDAVTAKEAAASDIPTEDFPVTDEMLDEAVEDSFPASDPPSYPNPAGAPAEAPAEDDRRPG